MNTAKLKAAAEKARWGDWSAYKPHSGARGYEVRVGSEAVAQHCLKDDAAFIAEASPKVVLELIAALEAAEKRVAELSAHLSNAHAFIENTEAFGHEAATGIIKCGDAEWNIDNSKVALSVAGINLETGGEA
ncbi:ead/Ea22-like family protein [Cronobacter dublinensis]|nr:ead/Ea22-like family protein [Cronobacter dublinensis]